MRGKMGILAVLVVVATAAGIMTGTRAARGQGVVHVVLPGNTVRSTLVDLGQEGLRRADRLAAVGPLLDETEAHRVGKSYFECVVHRRITDGGGLYGCTYLLRLEAGQIVLQGLDPRGLGTSTFAVLGGTGSYRTARGQATFTDTKGKTDMVIELLG